jgi:hypothetical protein
VWLNKTKEKNVYDPTVHSFVCDYVYNHENLHTKYCEVLQQYCLKHKAEKALRREVKALCAEVDMDALVRKFVAWYQAEENYKQTHQLTYDRTSYYRIPFSKVVKTYVKNLPKALIM